MYLTGDTAEAAGTAGPASGPSAGLYLTEPARGLAGLAFLPLAAPWLATAPRGDGHGVLVAPGLLATDTSTALLRRFLRRLGYDVRGWDLGRNRGPTEAVLDGLPRALAALAGRTGGPVSVVGWSLGGIYARELARQHPGRVRQVITLGSPFALTDPAAEPGRWRLPPPPSPARGWHAGAHARAGRPPDQVFRPRPCTRGGTASCPGRPASSRKRRSTRTSRSAAATSASAPIPRRCG